MIGWRAARWLAEVRIDALAEVQAASRVLRTATVNHRPLRTARRGHIWAWVALWPPGKDTSGLEPCPYKTPLVPWSGLWSIEPSSNELRPWGIAAFLPGPGRALTI